MTNHIIKPEEFINYHTEVVLASHSDPRKRLIFNIDTTNVNGQIELITAYFVKNKFDRLVHVGSHLQQAIKEYNKLS
jgi:hypothetical protein